MGGIRGLEVRMGVKVGDRGIVAIMFYASDILPGCIPFNSVVLGVFAHIYVCLARYHHQVECITTFF